MIHTVLMPRLGANIDSVKVVSWLKAVGDTVRKGDVLAELETEKSSFELEADEAGVLRHIAVEPGIEVSYNRPLAIIAGQGDDVAAAILALADIQAPASAAFVSRMDESVFDAGRCVPAVTEAGRARPVGTPKALALAGRHGIGAAELAGLAARTVRGFVTERDLDAYLTLPPAYIYGASTGAKQILEIVASGDRHRVVGVIDDNAALHGRLLRGLPVLGGIDTLVELAGKGPLAVLVASHSHNRRKVFAKLAERVPQAALPPVVDARAIVMSDVTIGDGALIEAGCVLGHEVSIGAGVLLNLGAKLSHNCVVGAYTHLTIGTSVSGAVTIGANCLIGAGVAVNPAVTIGDNVIVTPGSAVLNDLPANVTASGNPAKIIGDSKRGAA